MPRLRDWRPLALVVLACVFARLVGGKLPYYLLWFSLGLVGGGFVWAWRLRRALSVSVDVTRQVAARGEPLPVLTRVENGSFLPVPWLEMTEASARTLVSCDLPAQATSLPPGAVRVLRFQLTPERRGYFPVGPVHLRTGDPFGIFQVEVAASSEQPVTVYPRPVPLPGLAIPLAQPFGPVRTRQVAFEDPANLAGIRPFQAGDSPRHIHWRTSARLGAWHLKEFELSATTEMHIFVDMAAAVHVEHERLSTEETAVELAASLALLGRQRNLDFSLTAYGQARLHVSTGRGQRQMWQAMQVLAQAKADGQMHLARVLDRATAHLSQRSTLAVITPHLDSALAAHLLRLRTRHRIWAAVLKAETFAPWRRSTRRLERSQSDLAALLAQRGCHLYLIGAGDDLASLPALRLLPEGQRPGPNLTPAGPAARTIP